MRTYKNKTNMGTTVQYKFIEAANKVIQNGRLLTTVSCKGLQRKFYDSKYFAKVKGNCTLII